MPKGGDIHSHLGGAVYAESYLAWAAEEDYCVREVAEELELLKCSKDSVMSPLGSVRK
jgi:adenosine deaminase/adenosine deaminase CECR1